MLRNSFDDREVLIERFEKMIAKEENIFFDSMEFENIISHYLESAHFPMAERASTMAVELYPYSNDLAILHAETLLFSGKNDEAREVIERVEALVFGNPDLLLVRGLYHTFKEEHEEALTDYLEALPNHNDPGRILGLIAHEYIFLEKYDHALKYYKKALDENPDDEAMLIAVAQCYDVLDRLDELQVYLMNYIDTLDPYSITAWHQMGLSYLKQKNYEKAVWALDYAAIIHDDFPAAYYDLARAHEHLEHYADALKCYKQIFKSDSSPIAFLRAGKCYEKLGDMEMASEYYLKAVHLDPQLDKGWYALAQIHFENDMQELAQKYIEKALYFDPGNLEYVRYAIDVYREADKHDKVISLFESLIAEVEHNTEDWMDYGWYLYSQGDYDRSIRLLTDAAHLFPHEEELDYHLAATYLAKGDSRTGINLLKGAIQKNPDLIEVLYNNYIEVFSHPEVAFLLRQEQLI